VRGEPRQTTISTKLADGAVAVATSLLRDNPTNDRGVALLRFALAVDPECPGALLLQAKLDRGQELPAAELSDGGKAYVAFVQSVIAKSKSSPRQLLLWKVVELVEPDNESALLALTKAKNAGTATEFETLLTALAGEKAGAAEAAPAASASGPAPPAGAPAVQGDSPSAQALASAPVRADAAADPRAALHALACPQDCGVSSRVILMVRDLNKILAVMNSHVVVFLCTKRPDVQVSSYNSDGWPSYCGGGTWGVSRYYRNLTPRKLTCWEYVRRLAFQYDLGYFCQPGRIVFTEKDNPQAVAELGLPADAATLATQFKSDHAGTLGKYRNKLVSLQGKVSGLASDGGRTGLNLADDTVRVMLDVPIPADELAKVKEALNRNGPAPSRPQEFPAGTVYFWGSAVCVGPTGGKIVLRGCKEYTVLYCDR